MNRKKIVLNKYKSKNSTDKKISLKGGFLSSKRDLPSGEINETLSLAQQTFDERNYSEKYKIQGKISVFASNVLMNWSGDGSLKTFFDNNENNVEFDFENEDNIRNLLITNNINEENGWFYYDIKSTSEKPCNQVMFEPLRERFLPMDLFKQNWDITVTYPAFSDKGLTFNNTTLEEGIPIISVVKNSVENQKVVEIITLLNHGLIQGDIIEIFDGDNNTSLGEHVITNIPSENGEVIFQILDLQFDAPNSNGVGSYLGIDIVKMFFKKKNKGVYSEYYGRYFKKITINNNSIDVYNMAFEKTIFSDDVYGFTIKNPLDLKGVVDNLGRPIIELGICIVKNRDYNDDNTSFWTKILTGYNPASLDSNYDINTINTIESSRMYNLGEHYKESREHILTDIVEYSPVDCEEYVLEDIYHRINTIDREKNGFLEGYYYKHTDKIKINELSNIVNSSTVNDFLVPNYAKLLEDGRYVWRDVLPKNFSDIFPFSNGCHYVYENINKYVRRQYTCSVNDSDLPLIDDSLTKISSMCFTKDNYKTTFDICNTE